MKNKKYTTKDFKKFKDDLDLSNEDLANILGLVEGSVKNQIPKGVTTWMTAMLYMYEKQKVLLDEIRRGDDLNKVLIKEIKSLKKKNETK